MKTLETKHIPFLGASLTAEYEEDETAEEKLSKIWTEIFNEKLSE